jgi:hypothetical protein
MATGETSKYSLFPSEKMYVCRYVSSVYILCDLYIEWHNSMIFVRNNKDRMVAKDEMNIYVPQSYQTVCELDQL